MTSENKQQTFPHPPWHQPKADLSIGRLVVNNSLTETKVPFFTIDPAQKLVTWYICGPTVYDSAHMGHARAYMTFDIIHRLLTDYFGYELFYVMNITDIDDKIILRARRNHLLKEYAAKVTVEDLIRDIHASIGVLKPKREQAITAAAANVPTNARAKEQKAAEDKVKEAKLKLDSLVKVENEAKRLIDQLQTEEKKQNTVQVKALMAPLIKAASEPLSEWLDNQFGATVSDQQIFRAHAAYYENEFLEDMRNLGIREPTVLTRVTEYVDKIVEYIKKIIEQGAAYESNGSVYFHVDSFCKSHDYAKLAPQHKGNLELAEEGEGALGSGGGEKRNKSDFALWKKSKPGEPFWPSPWGNGRPGWHIECSVMASDMLGTQFDIHSGGVDLKFPHHDNELAQAEAHDNSQQWVNYFLHAGHLNIEGLKMSKSLKNFLTIRDILKDYPARQIRLFFLSVAWDGDMNFSDQSLAEAASREKTFREFFLNAKAAIRQQGDVGKVSQIWDEADRRVFQQLTDAKSKIHAFLCDNFDFPHALDQLMDVVNKYNQYVRETKTPKVFLIKTIAAYVDRILRAFGVIQTDDFGFASQSQSTPESALAPMLDAFTKFRDQVRQGAQKKVEHKELLQACDVIRDDTLPQLGVRLEDKENGAVWKLDDPAVLIAERDRKRNEAKTNAINKVKSKLDSRKKTLDSVQLVPAKDAIRNPKYSQYDEKGIPTHDDQNNALSKNARKGAEKDFNKLDADFKKHEANLQKNPKYLDEMREEIAALAAEYAALTQEK